LTRPRDPDGRNKRSTRAPTARIVIAITEDHHMEQRIRAHGRAILVLGGALLLAATLGAGAVFATSGGSPAGAATSLLATATAAPTTTPATGPAARVVLRGILRRTVSADLTLKTKTGYRTIRYERGQVTSVGSASVTVETADGVSTTFAVTAQTRLRAAGKAITLSQLHAGDRAMVFATEQDGSFTAYLVRCVHAAPTTAPAVPATPAATTPGNP
jgi:uncharacterized protein DUF5666